MNADNGKWSLVGVWNQQLTFGRGGRELEKREHIWASEIGKDYYERWLKMNAVIPDFDYDERTLRKFEAGNFFERIIGFVLVSAGLLIHDNKWYRIPESRDRLAVSVKPDFIAGGNPDWEKTKRQIDGEMLFNLMPNLGRIAERLVQELSAAYPDGVKEMVYEIKSLNSQVFWSKKEYLQGAYPHHSLQTLTAMKATGIPEGRVLYISKDDLTIAEFPILLSDGKLNALWEEDVRKMTEYIRGDDEPPKPESVIFDPRANLRFRHKGKKRVIEGCFIENWQVGWSNYISKITGIKGKSQADVAGKWRGAIKSMIKEKNDELKERFRSQNT